MKPYKAQPHEIEQFLMERERYNLYYRCQDCIHAIPDTFQCSLGYPNTILRESEHFLENSGEFIFCKYFEVD